MNASLNRDVTKDRPIKTAVETPRPISDYVSAAYSQEIGPIVVMYTIKNPVM